MKKHGDKLQAELNSSSSFYTIMGLVIVLFTAVVGYSLGEIQQKFPEINVLAVFAICSGLIVTGSAIVAYTIRGRVLDYVSKILERLAAIETTVSRITLGADREMTEVMLSQYEFINFERQFGGNEIWIISSSLENDEPGKGPYFPIVEQNLKRSIRYRYFYPETSSVKGIVIRLGAALSAYSTMLNFHPLPPEVFRLHVGKNIGVYRNTKTGVPDVAYVEIKFDKTVRWAKVDDQLAVDIVGWLGQYIEPKA